MEVAALHELPLKVATSPPPTSAATQNVADGQDTELPRKGRIDRRWD